MAVDKKEQTRMVTKKHCQSCGVEKDYKKGFYNESDMLCINCLTIQENQTKHKIAEVKKDVKQKTNCFDFSATEKEVSKKDNKYIELTLKFKVPYVDMPEFSGDK